MYEDNRGSIALAQTPKFHRRIKYIKIRYYLTRDYAEKGDTVVT